MTVVMPDSREVVKGGALTPAGVQLLTSLIDAQNNAPANNLTEEQIAVLNAFSVADITTSGAVEDPADPLLDTDGANRSDWVSTWGLLVGGSATNAQIQDGGAYSMGRIQSIYNRQKLIIERQNEIVAALVAAGLMEQT